MNKVTFRCKRSGNTISFTNEDDIRGLRQHEGYEEVLDAQATETVEAKSQTSPTEEMLTPRRGRPRKQPIPDFLQE